MPFLAGKLFFDSPVEEIWRRTDKFLSEKVESLTACCYGGQGNRQALSSALNREEVGSTRCGSFLRVVYWIQHRVRSLTATPRGGGWVEDRGGSVVVAVALCRLCPGQRVAVISASARLSDRSAVCVSALARRSLQIFNSLRTSTSQPQNPIDRILPIAHADDPGPMLPATRHCPVHLGTLSNDSPGIVAPSRRRAPRYFAITQSLAI
ncbi:hypothetical protein IWZ01DRAFT_35954 [Phyllosticta capitalensis]